MDTFFRHFYHPLDKLPIFLVKLPTKIEIKQWNTKDYAAFAYFINPNEKKWSKTRLNHLRDLYKSLNDIASIEKFYSSHEIGYPDSQKDYCEPYFVYFLCCNYKMDISNRTTLLDMSNFLRYRKYNREELINLASLSLFNKSNDFLASLIEIPNEEKTRSFKNYTTVQRRLAKPLNKEEAVILAALNYSINLALSDNAQEEYMTYNPEKKYLKLFERYEPTIPSWAYGSSLTTLLKAEGFEDNFPVQEALTLLTIENNFYSLSKYDNKRIENKETPFYNEKVELQDPFIGYGLLGSTWQVLTIEELKAFFDSQLSFVNPFDKNEKLNERIIKKLEYHYPSQLSEVINKIRTIEKSQNKVVKELLLLKDKSVAIEALKSLLTVSFYMRGWNEGEEIPLINTEVKDQNKVDQNVNYALNQYNNIDCNIVNQLPLVIYDKGVFNLSTDKSKGITIKDRINIVMHEHDNVNSCIRLSSNWLLSSAYYYLSLIKEKPNFDIALMRNIA